MNQTYSLRSVDLYITARIKEALMMQWHLLVVARPCLRLGVVPRFLLHERLWEGASARESIPAKKITKGNQTFRREGEARERYTKENLFLRGERKKGRVRKPGERGAVHSDGAQEQSNFIRVDLDAGGRAHSHMMCVM